jgi:O-antigen/teichoic acid export membrane protein
LSSQISVRKTGLIVFASRIASVFTGLTFLVLMTRTLSASQFGLWEVIIDLVTFASYPAGLVAFWATRDVARGRWVGKTAIAMNLTLSSAGVLLYLLFTLFTYPAVRANIQPLLLATMLVPLSYWNMAANAIVTGHRPEALGYSVIASEVSKLAVAIPLLLIFRTGITGVIASMLVAYFAQAAVSSYMVRDAGADSVSASIGGTWLRKSWLPAIITLPYVVGIADTFVASIAAGGTNVTGYYQAAFSVASIAGYSIYLAAALYPLLLKGGSEDLPSITLDLSLLFGIPMATIAAVLARPILFFLKPQYMVVSNALGIMAFAAVIASVSGIIDQTLLGRERVDTEESADLKRYLPSDLIFVPVVNIAYAVVYVASIYLTIAFGMANQFPIAQIVEYWAVAQLVTSVIFLLAKVRRVRRKTKLELYRSTWGYLAGSAIMGVVAYALSYFLNYGAQTLVFGAELTVAGLIALAVYVFFLFATDHEFRELARSVIKSAGLGREVESSN